MTIGSSHESPCLRASWVRLGAGVCSDVDDESREQDLGNFPSRSGAAMLVRDSLSTLQDILVVGNGFGSQEFVRLRIPLPLQ